MKVEQKQNNMRTQQYNQVTAIVAKYANLASNTEAAKTMENSWRSARTVALSGGDSIIIPPTDALLGRDYMSQLLARIYQLKAVDNVDAGVLKAYSKDLSYYIDGLLSSDEELFLVDNFDIFVDYAFKDGLSFNDSHDIRFDGFSEWSSIVSDILEKKSGKVFVPVSDSGREFTGLSHCDITVAADYANAAIRALACGQSIHRYETSELETRLWSDVNEGYFDIAIVSKADNMLWGTENVQDRFDAVYRIVKENGEILFSVSRDDMLSDATSAMRHMLVKNRILRHVIQLPSGDMLLHIVKKKQDKCIMIDASGMSESSNEHIVDAKVFCKENAELAGHAQQCFARQLYFKELTENILVADYYLSRCGNRVPVANLSAISSDSVISDDCSSDEKVVTVNNLSHVFSNSLFLVTDLQNVNKERLRRYHRIEGPAVVMAVSKKDIAIGYTTDNSSFLVPKNLYALKPREGVDVRFLACTLFDDNVKSQLMKLVYGKGLGSKLTNNWGEFVCLNEYAVGNQQAFIQHTTEKDYAEQKRYVESQELNFKRTIRLRKHALSQNISAFDSLFHTLEYCMNENMGRLRSDMKLSSVSDMTVGGAFTALRSGLDVICSRVAHLTDEQDWGVCENIEPQAFIENYEQKHGEAGFQYKHMWNQFEPNVFSKDIFDKETGKLLFHRGETLNAAWFPKRALTQVFDNIVANAREHGFTDKSRTDYAIRTSWETDGLNMIIRISNNGAPLQKGVDADRVLEYGYSTALNKTGHGGIGGGEIAEIMHRFGGDVKVESTPTGKFAVTYVLSMPLASMY